MGKVRSGAECHRRLVRQGRSAVPALRIGGGPTNPIGHGGDETKPEFRKYAGGRRRAARARVQNLRERTRNRGGAHGAHRPVEHLRGVERAQAGADGVPPRIGGIASLRRREGRVLGRGGGVRGCDVAADIDAGEGAGQVGVDAGNVVGTGFRERREEEGMAREEDDEQVYEGETTVGFVGVERRRDTLLTTGNALRCI